MSTDYQTEADRGVAVTLRQDLAQALWTAMHDDDDLAEDMLQRSVHGAISRVIDELPPHFWTRDAYRRIVELMASARIDLDLSSLEMAKRWHSYAEPPF